MLDNGTGMDSRIVLQTAVVILQSSGTLTATLPNLNECDLAREYKACVVMGEARGFVRNKDR